MVLSSKASCSHTLGAGIPREDELLKLYACLSGRPYPLPGWPFCKAFWFFKYAVIAQGVQARLQLGSATSSIAAKVGAMAPLLMEMCLQHIDEFNVEAKM
jgi:aminoglycoside phosphotransferase (APT) family kinase protein